MRKTSVEEFLSRSVSEVSHTPQYTVLEPVNALSPTQLQSLVVSMDKLLALQVPYNFSMVMNSESLNCSEFVHKVFADAVALQVGQIEALKEMDIHAYGGALMKLWGDVPPLDSQVLTPVSVVNSLALRVVTTTLPVEKILSESEIFDAWKVGGGIKKLANLYGAPKEMFLALGSSASSTPYRSYPAAWRKSCADALTDLIPPKS